MENRLKKHRTALGLSQDVLAEKIFVSRQSISNWENDKNYPDLNSLVLLSSLFDVPVDMLIKGDIENMRDCIKTEDITQFNRDSKIFTSLMVSLILSPVPLVYFAKQVGFVILILLALVTLVMAIRIEKTKKNFDIQTYKEILAFTQSTTLNERQSNQEIGKRPYQKFLLAMGTGVLTIIIAILMYFLLF